jgi:hypothetical protein
VKPMRAWRLSTRAALQEISTHLSFEHEADAAQ